MRTRHLGLGLAFIIGACLLAGCHEYQITVAVDADGSGVRTITLDTKHELDGDDRRLWGLVGDGWTVEGTTEQGGDRRWRYRREHRVDRLDRWRETGSTLLRGTPDGRVRLISAVQVEQIRGASGTRHVYRESLGWAELREEVADLVARNYAAFLRHDFPALPDSLVHEARGAMAATIVLSWRELVAGDEDSSPEQELGERFNQHLAQRLLRAGVAPALTQAVVRATAAWDYFGGLEEAIPGLDHCLESSLVLTVAMPGEVVGGNADTVEGNLATFKVDLAETLEGPVILEVVSES
jgi:hypothetical protein